MAQQHKSQSQKSQAQAHKKLLQRSPIKGIGSGTQNTPFSFLLSSTFSLCQGRLRGTNLSFWLWNTQYSICEPGKQHKTHSLLQLVWHHTEESLTLKNLEQRLSFHSFGFRNDTFTVRSSSSKAQHEESLFAGLEAPHEMLFREIQFSSIQFDLYGTQPQQSPQGAWKKGENYLVTVEHIKHLLAQTHNMRCSCSVALNQKNKHDMKLLQTQKLNMEFLFFFADS